MNIKCIGCYDLRRDEMKVSPEQFKAYKKKGDALVTYFCPRFFPYATTLSGLLRPGKGILEAVKLCPDNPLSHCILCSETEITHYGGDITGICEEHGQAWGRWLDEHPERRAYLSPRHRAIKANWVEVFREFIEDMRVKSVGEPL